MQKKKNSENTGLNIKNQLELLEYNHTISRDGIAKHVQELHELCWVLGVICTEEHERVLIENIVKNSKSLD